MKDSAVSPVIGILLMLVVTIIIAAVVSGFAGGLIGNQSKAPQASISVNSHINSLKGIETDSYVWSYPTDYTEDNNYLLFEHKGGDGFSLSDIKIQLEQDNSKYTISLSDSPANATLHSCRADPDNSVYLEEIGDSDGYIKSGDQFKLIFDGNYKASWGSCMYIQKSNALKGYAYFLNEKIGYTIIDSDSGKAIQTGSFTLTM